MPTARLSDRAVIQVFGEDAPGFLQGLVTCNVEDLAPGEARWGALLSPQGKILFDFLVLRVPDDAENLGEFGAGYWLDTASETADALVKRLTLYKLRAKVTVRLVFEAGEPLAVAAAWGEDRIYQEDAVKVRDARSLDLGERLYLWEHDAEAISSEDEGAYHAHRIALGIPEGGRDFTYGDAFPHEALMDQLGGVDFRKGCYVGQEVVSRMQHRGTARTRILPVRYPEGSAPAAGTEVTASGKALGRTGSAAGDRGLALLRLDRLGEAKASGEVPRAGEAPVEASLPPFATFTLPEPSTA